MTRIGVAGNKRLKTPLTDRKINNNSQGGLLIPTKALIPILLLCLVCPSIASAGFDDGCCGGAPVACSCESCHPFQASTGDSPALILPVMSRVEVSDPSDPSATVPSEVFRPPIS